MLTKKDPVKNESKTLKNLNTSTTSAPATKTTPTALSERTPSQQASTNFNNTANAKTEHYTPINKPQQKTKIIIRYDVGFNNQFTIRGKGANLTWEKGQPLKNVKADEWIYETDAHFSQIEFKVLLNDQIYEKGENHLLNFGSHVVYSPML